MKLFNIYIKKSEDQKVQASNQENLNNPQNNNLAGNSGMIEEISAIKTGFHYGAFIFNLFWFLFYRMWKEALILSVVNLVMVVIYSKGIFTFWDLIIMIFGLSLIMGLNAGYWLEQFLRKENYKFVGCVFGKNKEEAKLRFISNYFKSQDDDVQSQLLEQMMSPSILDVKDNRKAEPYFTV